jgi:AmiR/NasT family two-component response regulator
MDDSIELAEKLLEAGSVDRLVQALEGRLTLGQGIGIAMERHQLDEDHALQYVVFEASRRAQTVREAAQSLVDGCNAESEPVDPYGLTVRPVTRFLRNGSRRTA